MSNQRVWTNLTFGNVQLFPKSLTPLQRFWGGDRVGDYCMARLIEVSKDIPGLRLEEATRRSSTSDGYDWFWSPTFDTRDGRVMVAFPWCQDFRKNDGTSTDRHITIYAAGNPTAREIDKIISKLNRELRAYERRSVQKPKTTIENGSLVYAG